MNEPGKALLAQNNLPITFLISALKNKIWTVKSFRESISLSEISKAKEYPQSYWKIKSYNLNTPSSTFMEMAEANYSV